jgi:hypothetical protein
VGTSPAAGNATITAGNRIFKAYPGIEYNIRAVAVGGAYPYLFALSGTPAGMSIDIRTGEIRWPSPSGATATPTITVTDAEGAQRSSEWTITVTTDDFHFVDAVNGSPSGSGTIDSPWGTISNMTYSPNTTAGDVVYFRQGNYDVLDMRRGSVGSPWERVEFPPNKPNAWVAYPGETPVLDFGFVPGGDSGVLLRLEHTNLYIDGFETRNSRVIAFQIGNGSYGVFRRLTMRDHNVTRVNLDGANAAFIMTLSGYSDSNTGGNASSWGQYLAIQDNEFFNAPVDMALKMYSQWKLLIEDNDFHDLFFGVELKADLPQFTYRGNRHSNIPGRAIGGNMHSYSTHGEILFNLVNEPNGKFALDVNQDGQARRIDIYRNTFIGRVRVRNTDSSDGPFNFWRNVIVNSDRADKVFLENVSAPSRIVLDDNLTGRPGAIVDDHGILLAEFIEYLNSHGAAFPRIETPSPPP